MSEAGQPDILVACVGNGLAGDDGAGEAVYRQLQADRFPVPVQLVMLGLGGMALLDYLRGQRLLVVVDAVQLSGQAGTLHILDGERIQSTGSQAVSLHGIGLKDTLTVSQTLYPESTPRETVLIGIEGKCFNELGAPLSEEVAAAIGPAVAAVKQQIIRSLRVEKQT
jgi:hydrogenase maturation protease